MIVHNFEQRSPEWFKIRLAKITGTTLNGAVKEDNLGALDALLAEYFTEQPAKDNEFTSYAMERGNELQPHAIKEYEKRFKVEVIPVGFIQSEKYPMFGASPDGFVGEEGGLEVKCEGSVKHMKYWRQNQLPADHKWQVYAPFLIDERFQWWDFVSYHPSFKDDRLVLFRHRTYRKDIEAELKQADIMLKKFFDKVEKYKAKILF